MNSKFDFNNLFIFEMANNHQGSVEHGLKIIQEVARVAKVAGITNVAVKLQLRHLDTFVHPKHQTNSDNKHIPRFFSTRLNEVQFSELLNAIKTVGLIPMVTPFDEASVEAIERLGVPIIKIASCSANDWPLLEKIAVTGKPVVASTGGLAIADIDKIVSFFQHRGVHFALEHCVAIYPTPNEKMQLNQVEILRKRYPGIVVGFSTHEDPNNTTAIQIAYSRGARIFEKHVGVTTDKIKLNSYSANPEQLAAWLASYKVAVAMCGADNRPPSDHEESASLRSLMRGVFARKNLKVGTPLSSSAVYFAMPIQPGQLSSSEWKEFLVADRDYTADEAISEFVTKERRRLPRELIASYVHELKGALNSANINVGVSPNIELSHHYGLERFREYGAAIIDCINREYCKKIIIQFAGQKHPQHFHNKKEETYQVLHGELVVQLDGRTKHLYPGDVLVVPRATWHSFTTPSGVIFEEVSTTHFNDDSFYEDKDINRMARERRKTKLINWGSHQFD